MPYDIILGRDASDKKKFGKEGLIYLGRGYVTMGTHTSLSNHLWMDVARSHVVLVAGKRGSGKSYSLGVIAEELSNLTPELARNIGSLIFDTMGIFWTMKFKNEKDAALLRDWNLETKPLNVRVLVPKGKADNYKEMGVPFDDTFALSAAELNTDDWLSIFNLAMTSPEGTLLARTISHLKQQSNTYTIKDIKQQIQRDTQTSHDTKNSIFALLDAAETWGVFSMNAEGTQVKSLVKGGQTTVLDLSVYSATSAFNVRALVISLISRKLFNERMEERKKEELQSLQHGVDYLAHTTNRDMPLVWLFVDEAHEFLPKEGKTPATEALVQILREGRQPGISLVLATQQPGQIHRDVMTQSDIVISHKLTSQQDLEALNQIMQSYILEHINRKMDELPQLKGSALILDDNSERIYPMRVRPRFTWHGGEAPSAVKTEISF
ncbi:MAG TPA: DUF87 domain-containing protein [Candidatus Nanoarchaeia archaeon]|nr:DUF87 domain-containing protein [Candidatus Nanoarchaeia archaeon]